MDYPGNTLYFRNMNDGANPAIPAYALYGEGRRFPDILHCERISDRASLHDWQIAPHRHPNLHQFFLIRSGSAWVTVDGRGRDLNLPTLLSIPAWIVHGFRFSAGTEGFVLTVPLSELPEAFGDGAPLAPALSAWGAAPAGASLETLFEQILHQRGLSDAARAPMLRALALQIACQVARGLHAQAPANLSRYARHMQAFEALVRNHLRDGWTLRDYAAALSLTPTHLNRISRAVSGQSAGRFVESRQFHEACRLLAYTQMSIAEVGYALGFDDPAYFSRAFRRQTGETPSRYRKRLASTDLPDPALRGVS
ncbi:MAG: AraC family protein [Rhodobacteraceae bacterium HLUCCA12]|nr:MAG: AraC family protein [Rhodobacteraceae bacterium HLUCCA12]